MIQSFRDIIALWDLPSELAEEIGAKANTVSKWAQRDFVPPEWWTAVGDAAQRRGFEDVTAARMAKLAEARRAAA